MRWAGGFLISLPSFRSVFGLTSHRAGLYRVADFVFTNSIIHQGVNNGIQNSVLKQRMVRNFADKPVDQKVVDQIVQLIRYTPSTGITQESSFIIATQPRLKKAIEDSLHFCKVLCILNYIRAILSKYFYPFLEYILLDL